MSHGQPDLFDPRNVPPQPMARSVDPLTSHLAAAFIMPHLGSIQQFVVMLFWKHGRMTARTAETLPEAAARYGYSTIRKRISELVRAGVLVVDGVEGTPPASVYRLRDDLIP